MMRIKRSPITFFKHFLFFVRVEGESMWPLLIPGQSYLASSLIRPSAGSIVIFGHGSRRFVKKILEIRGQDYVVGSNVSWGTSGNDIGLVPRHAIVGTLLRYERKN